MTGRKKMIIFFIIIVLVVWYFKFANHYPRQVDLQAKNNFWGVTFSDKFATDLGLDWQETYTAILDDLKVKYIRLPIYWDQIEAQEGVYDFAAYDAMLNQGAERDVKFIVNVGWRLPRWPECHAPEWMAGQDIDVIQTKTLLVIEKIIKRYQGRPEIIAWQVENEPLLDWFGECPEGDKEFLTKEVAFVRNLDDTRPIIVSASGELSFWHEEAKLADIFATTMYRVVWNKWFGYFRYPWPAWFYKEKAYFLKQDKENIIISELQTEPWVPNGTLDDIEFTEYEKSFSLEQFRANLQFAINVDFKQTYLWGVEWWYLQKQQGNPGYWSQARELFY